MRDFVINLLNAGLSRSYYYHRMEHTLYVTDKVLEIGKHENCTDEELRLLNAAALWHDTGFVKTYSNHEEESCLLARQHLPEYGFNASEIEKICGMIMATKIPQTPKNKLEEIIADADLEYLGTEHANKEATCLFEELKSIIATLSADQWNDIQISFLQKHKYFTKYCRENKEPNKEVYLKSLIGRKIQ